MKIDKRISDVSLVKPNPNSINKRYR